MTLFELFYIMERVFIFNKRKLKINSIEYCFIEDVPYYLLKKEVNMINYYDNVIEIILK